MHVTHESFSLGLTYAIFKSFGYNVSFD